MNIGFFLGSMSGPGSGSHSRLVALAEALASGPIHIFLYGTGLQLEGIEAGPNVTLRKVPESYRFLRRLFGPVTARASAKRDSLEVLHFETLPVYVSRTRKTILSIHHPPSLLITLSNSLPYRCKTRIRLALLRRAAKRSHAIVTLTDWSRLEILRTLNVPAEKVFLVPFSHSENLIAQETYVLQDSLGFVLVLGHIERRKNIATLVSAVAHAQWPQGITLMVAGRDHGERYPLERLAKKLGVEVIFTGPVSNEDKALLLSNALCLAMPSLLEGFGIPIAESVSRGTPALVSDQAALPEVVGTSNAVVPALDSARWAEKIRELYLSPRTREELLMEERQHLAKYNPEFARRAYLQCLRT